MCDQASEPASGRGLVGTIDGAQTSECVSGRASDGTEIRVSAQTTGWTDVQAYGCIFELAWKSRCSKTRTTDGRANKCVGEVLGSLVDVFTLGRDFHGLDVREDRRKYWGRDLADFSVAMHEPTVRSGVCVCVYHTAKIDLLQTNSVFLFEN